MSSPFDLFKDIAYEKYTENKPRRKTDVSEVYGSEFMLNLILASADIDKANRMQKYLFKCDIDIFAGALYYNVKDVEKMRKWMWQKKKKESSKKLVKYVDAYIEFISKQTGKTFKQIKSEYGNIILHKCENDKEYMKHVLIDMKADEKTFKSFKVEIPKEMKEKVQVTLF